MVTTLRFLAIISLLTFAYTATRVYAEPVAEPQPAAQPNQKAAPTDATPPAADANGKTPATPELIKQWIGELDSDQYATRDEATKKLTEAGPPAIEPLAESLGSESREVSMRAMEILKKFLQSQFTETKEKARAALEKLAKSENETVARRAAAVLKPDPQPPTQQQPRMRGGIGGFPGGRIQFGGGIQIGGGGIQIGPGGKIQVLQAARTIQLQNANGKKTIDAEEDGKKVHIDEEPGGGISMSVTETVDGKEFTSKYAAKDSDDLKKNHPDAEKLYRKYNDDNGLGRIQIQIQAPALPGGGGAVPFPVPLPQPFAPVPAQPKKDASARLIEVRKIVSEVEELLKKQGPDKANADDVRKALQRLEEAQKKLEELQGQLN